MQTGNPDHGIGFINRTIGGDADIVFGNARPVAKCGFALVTGFRVDACQLNHVPSILCRGWKKE